MKDSLLVYDYEGKGSPAGSVGCGSLVDSDDDLQFLDDIGAKFKTLSEICIPKLPQPPTYTAEHVIKKTVNRTIETPIVKPKIEHVNQNINAKTTTTNHISSSSNINISKSSSSTLSTSHRHVQPPSTSSSQVTKVQNIKSATLPPPSKMVLVQQQPIYYTTSPMMQPMQYIPVGQPQLQNMLFAGSHAGSIGAQGVYVVNGSQNPLTGMVINDAKGSGGSSVVTNSVSPTVLGHGLPGSPGSPSWNLMAPGSGGAYTLVEAKLSSSGAQGFSPVSAQGTLPRGEILVNEATSGFSPTMMMPGSPSWNLMAPGAGGAYRLVETQLSSSGAQGFSPVSVPGTLPRGEILVNEATSGVSPTMLMPGSPSWNLMAPGAGGAYRLVETQLSSSGAQGFSSMSVPGTLPRGEILVKEATSGFSPTMMMPGSPSWNLMAPGSGGNYMLVETQVCSGEVQVSNPVSSQGTLPGGGTLEKEAAPPQGALSQAAMGSVYGLWPEHTISTAGRVILKRNVGDDLVGNTGHIMLESGLEVGPSAEQSGEQHILPGEGCSADISHSVPVMLIPPINESTARHMDMDETAQTFESSDENVKKEMPLNTPIDSNTEICEDLENVLELKGLSIAELETLKADDVSHVVTETPQNLTPTSVIAVSGEFEENIQESMSDIILQQSDAHTPGEKNTDHGSTLTETVSNKEINQIPEEIYDNLAIMQSPITEDELMGFHKEEPELLVASQNVSEDLSIVPGLEVGPSAEQSGDQHILAGELQPAQSEGCSADISHSVPVTLIPPINESTARHMDMDETAQTFESSDTNVKKEMPLNTPIDSNTEICEDLENVLELKGLSIAELETLKADDVSHVVTETPQNLTPTSVIAVSGEFEENIQESMSDIILQQSDAHTPGEKNTDHENVSNKEINQIPEEIYDNLAIIQSPITEEELMGFHKEEPELLVASQNVSEDLSIVPEVSTTEGSLDLAGVAGGPILLSPEDELGLPVKHHEILAYQKAEELVAISRENELIPYIPQNANDSSACPESSGLLAEDSVHIEHADDKSEGLETEPKSRQIVEDMKEVQSSSLTENEKQEPVLYTDVGVNNEDIAMLATPSNQIDTNTENDPQESSDSEENAVPDLQTDQHLEENISKHQIDIHTENDPQESSDSEENAVPDLQTDQRLEENICKDHAIGYVDEVNSKATSVPNLLQLNTISDDHIEDCVSDCMLASAPIIANESIEEEVKGSIKDMSMLEQNQCTVEDISDSCHEKVSLELNITQNVAMEPDMHLPNDEEKEGSLTLKLDSPVPPKCSGIQDNDTEINNSQVEDYNTLAEKLDSDVVEYQEFTKRISCISMLSRIDEFGSGGRF